MKIASGPSVQTRAVRRARHAIGSNRAGVIGAARKLARSSSRNRSYPLYRYELQPFFPRASSSPRNKQTRQYKVGGDETKKNPLSKQSDGGNGSGTVLSIRDWGAPFCLLGVITIWGSHWHTRLACFGWPHTVRVLLLLFCFILSHVLLCTAGNSWEKVFALWAPVFV